METLYYLDGYYLDLLPSFRHGFRREKTKANLRKNNIRVRKSTSFTMKKIKSNDKSNSILYIKQNFIL